MRRFVLIFMMLLLPLQWSWAAAAASCEHESGKTHFGHHEHQHVGTTAAAADGGANADDTSPSGNHPDCQVCHGVGAACVAALDGTPRLWTEGPPRPAYSRHLPDPPVESFLRPPLSLVA